MLESCRPIDPSQFRNGIATASYGEDRNLFVEFELLPVFMEALSEEAGQPVYKDVEYITIMVPGNNKSTLVRPVLHEWRMECPPDSERWPAQYKAFKNQQLQVSEGTPLSNWPAVTKAIALNLKSLNLHTVEHLANASDHIIQNIFGGAEMQKLAKAYLRQAEDGQEVSRMNHALKDLTNENSTLKNQMKEAMAFIEELKAQSSNPQNRLPGTAIAAPTAQHVPHEDIMGMPMKRKYEKRAS